MSGLVIPPNSSSPARDESIEERAEELEFSRACCTWTWLFRLPLVVILLRVVVLVVVALPLFSLSIARFSFRAELEFRELLTLNPVVVCASLVTLDGSEWVVVRRSCFDGDLEEEDTVDRDVPLPPIPDDRRVLPLAEPSALAARRTSFT